MICVHCQTPNPEGSRFCTQCGADPSDPGSFPRATDGSNPADLLARLRTTLGERYDVKSLLGQGGMGAVFLAEDKTLERPVAIKVLPPEMSHNQHFVGRFEREARTAAKLDHANIIPIYAVESKEGLHFFVMKYVTGRSLDQVLMQGALPVDVTQRILWECASALGHAHRRGIIHRDIKPGNIMIDDSGRAMLTDFGISKALESATQFTATGQVIGTPHYMSPEQSRGAAVDGRSDIYSLGVVAYRMLTGQLPFGEGSVHTIIYKQIFEEPTPIEQLNAGVPAFLIAATRKAMAKEPADRFQTMEDFASGVWPENRMAGQSQPGVSGPITPVGPISSVEKKTEVTRPSEAMRAQKYAEAALAEKQAVARRRRAPVIAGVAGGALVAAAALGFIVLRGNKAEPPAAVIPARADTSHGVTVTPAAPAPTGAAVLPAGSATTTPPPQTKTASTSQAATRPAAQQPPPPTPAPAAQSFLTINASPFGTVYVDGVEVGDTPVVGYAMKAGRHVIEVRREGYRSAVDTVNSVAGNTTRLNKTLIKEQ
jgi:predicted Ser/Thr protein kinase